MTPEAPRTHDPAVAAWLFACCAMVFAMVVIGGITRLTESGLSMVEWRPLIGWLPPLGEAQWQAVFEKYQATPQYRLVTAGMTLADFKTIFWWEYMHRLWGRLIGVVFLLPFLWFLAKGRIGRDLAPRLVLLFVLGAAQGALGWYMVMSGLVDRPAVSQYRLAAHLGLAVAIYGLLLWTALDVRRGAAAGRHRAAPWGLALAGLIFATVLSGALVAGIDAGLAYNTFPLMGGQIVPALYGAMEPAWTNLFDNPAAVQFNHRVLALATVALIVVFRLLLGRAGLARRARIAADLLVAMAAVQAALGISTLLLFVPLVLAVAHQAGALALFTLALWLAFELRRTAAADGARDGIRAPVAP